MTFIEASNYSNIANSVGSVHIHCERMALDCTERSYSRLSMTRVCPQTLPKVVLILTLL